MVPVQEILYFIFEMMIMVIYFQLDMLEYVKNFFFGQPMNYKNKTAFITGANGGVGRNLCINLIKKGCSLICLEHPDCEESLEHFRENTLLKLNPNIQVLSYYVDLNNLEDVEEFAKTKLSEHIIHFSIFNAAINYYEDFLKVETEKCLRVVRVNFFSNMILLKYITHQMIKNKVGDIVAISSILSEHGFGNELAYSASKAAITSLLESASLYCDINKYDFIRFHTVFPAQIDTKLFAHLSLNKYGRYIVPLLKPEYVAQKTIEAISFNYREVYIPCCASKLFILAREFLTPKSLNRALKYALTSEVQPSDEIKQK